MQIKLKAPAKINLTLEVQNKRQDGFHNIKSIMQTIDLYDFLTISVEKTAEAEITLKGNSTEIPYDEGNLCFKAAKIFEQEAKIPPHRIEIYIEKNIPVSAGLAGGSTDAAATLFGLNELFGCPLDNKNLHALCAKLGSDLNFCLVGGRQLASSRGEILSPLEFEEFQLSLIKPCDLGISAKEAYTKFEKRGKRGFENDLEGAIINDYPQLQKIKRLYPKAIMSGSGSSFFLIDTKITSTEGYWVKNGLKSIPTGVEVI